MTLKLTIVYKKHLCYFLLGEQYSGFFGTDKVYIKSAEYVVGVVIKRIHIGH